MVNTTGTVNISWCMHSKQMLALRKEFLGCPCRHVYMSYAYRLLGASFSASPARHGYASVRVERSRNQLAQEIFHAIENDYMINDGIR